MYRTGSLLKKAGKVESNLRTTAEFRRNWFAVKNVKAMHSLVAELTQNRIFSDFFLVDLIFNLL